MLGGSNYLVQTNICFSCKSCIIIKKARNNFYLILKVCRVLTTVIE